MNVELVKTYRFEAAHELPYLGGAKRLHGHSYEVDVVVAGACDETLEWLIDYAEITTKFDGLYRTLDHHTLNNIAALDDVRIEGVREWILRRLSERLHTLKDVRVRIVGECAFNPVLIEADAELGLPERVGFGFEAAHSLPRLPADHKCYRMHGHSFRVEAAGDLGTLERALKDVYDMLDHRCLNEIAGLGNPTSESISRWIWQRLEAAGAGPEAVVVAETCTARCIYRGR